MMKGPFILNYDIGTTGCKSLLFDLQGNVVISAWAEYPLVSPQPLWFELLPYDIWNAVATTTNEILKKTEIDPSEILAVTSDGLGPSWVGVNKFCEPTTNVVIYSDQRDLWRYKGLSRDRGKCLELYPILGIPPWPAISPKPIWFKENSLETYNKTVCFLPNVKDFILNKLVNASTSFTTDWCCASVSGGLDVKSTKWSERAFEIYPSTLGIDDLREIINKLPYIRAPYDVIGEISARVASETGLSKDTKVVAGCLDTFCMPIGSGAATKELATLGLGGASNLTATINEPIFDEKMRVIISPHPLPNLYVIFGPVLCVGTALRWFRDNFAMSEVDVARRLKRSPYELMDDEAVTSPAGAKNLLFLPHLTGEMSPYWDPELRGAFVGLSFDHSKTEFIRAIMEGAVFQIRYVMEIIEGLIGLTFKGIKVIGGASKSKLWRQIIADILVKPVHWPIVEEATSLGAAILAGYGAGLYSDVLKVSETIAVDRDVQLPNNMVKQKYERLFKVFKILVPSLERIFKDLSSMP